MPNLYILTQKEQKDVEGILYEHGFRGNYESPLRLLNSDNTCSLAVRNARHPDEIEIHGSLEKSFQPRKHLEIAYACSNSRLWLPETTIAIDHDTLEKLLQKPHSEEIIAMQKTEPYAVYFSLIIGPYFNKSILNRIISHVPMPNILGGIERRGERNWHDYANHD